MNTYDPEKDQYESAGQDTEYTSGEWCEVYWPDDFDYWLTNEPEEEDPHAR